MRWDCYSADLVLLHVFIHSSYDFAYLLMLVWLDGGSAFVDFLVHVML